MRKTLTVVLAAATMGMGFSVPAATANAYHLDRCASLEGGSYIILNHVNCHFSLLKN